MLYYHKPGQKNFSHFTSLSINKLNSVKSQISAGWHYDYRQVSSNLWFRSVSYVITQHAKVNPKTNPRSVLQTNKNKTMDLQENNSRLYLTLRFCDYCKIWYLPRDFKVRVFRDVTLCYWVASVEMSGNTNRKTQRQNSRKTESYHLFHIR